MLVEYRSAAGVIEPARRERLALEPLHRLAIAAERGVQHLDRDGAADAGVLAFVDAAHPAFTQDGIDAVAPVEDTTDRDDSRVVRRWRRRPHDLSRIHYRLRCFRCGGSPVCCVSATPG